MAKERPILFSAPMVRAILDGRKTMTRRVMNPQPSEQNGWAPYSYGDVHRKEDGEVTDKVWGWGVSNGDGDEAYVSKYGAPGDLLWVRETWLEQLDGTILYCADADEWDKAWKWKPSIFMPRKYSRITLEIIGVWANRLQEIDNNAALAEGTPDNGLDIRECFQHLWDSINGKRPGCAWSDNPWVWSIGFWRITP
jgi:hypothetical protein